MLITQPSIQHIMIHKSYRKTYRVAEWIARNSLKMNVNKTPLLVLDRKGKQCTADSVQVNIGHTRLQKQDYVKYLGVSIDKYLS